MDKEILQSIVKLTRLVNQLPVNQHLEKFQSTTEAKKGKLLNTDFTEELDSKQKKAQKLQRKMTYRVFEKVVALNKYVNPVNKKVLDSLMEDQRASVLYDQDGDAMLSTKVNNLYQHFVKETTHDLIEHTDRILDLKKESGEKKKTVENIIGKNRQLDKRPDLSMRKPQHQWWDEINNSYSPWVTPIDNKPHGTAPIPAIIVDN